MQEEEEKQNTETKKVELQKFESAKEMVDWLMINEYWFLHDNFGRVWHYSDYEFYFKDLGSDFVKGISCLHLFGTEFYINL